MPSASDRNLHGELIRMLREASGYEADIAEALRCDRAEVAVALRQLELRHVVERFDDEFGAWWSVATDACP